MNRAWIACTAAIVVLGCKSGEEPVRGAHQGVDPSAVYRPSPKPPEPSEVPIPEPLEPLDIVAETREEEEPERDLEAELKAALGTPTDCVQDFVASGPTTIRISVGATVRPTGVIIMPSAYGSGLSEAARQCIEQRVGLVVLQPLDDSVSQRVSTIVEINYEPPVIVEADPGVPEPRLRNVREPLPKRPDIPPSGRPPLPPRPEVAPSGRPIQEPTSRKIKGPKPRPIDGYDVDENAQDWR